LGRKFRKTDDDKFDSIDNMGQKAKKFSSCGELACSRMPLSGVEPFRFQFRPVAANLALNLAKQAPLSLDWRRQKPIGFARDRQNDFLIFQKHVILWVSYIQMTDE